MLLIIGAVIASPFVAVVVAAVIDTVRESDIYEIFE